MLAKLLKSEKIKPVMDAVFYFEDAQEVLVYLEKEKAEGKIVVEIKEVNLAHMAIFRSPNKRTRTLFEQAQS